MSGAASAPWRAASAAASAAEDSSSHDDKFVKRATSSSSKGKENFGDAVDVSSASDRASNTDKMEAMHAQLEALKECQRKSEQRILELTQAQENTARELEKERRARTDALEDARLDHDAEVDDLKDDIDDLKDDADEAMDEVDKLKEAAAIARKEREEERKEREEERERAAKEYSICLSHARHSGKAWTENKRLRAAAHAQRKAAEASDGGSEIMLKGRPPVQRSWKGLMCKVCNKGERGQWCARNMCRPCCMKAYADEDFCHRCPQHQLNEPSSGSSTSGWSSRSRSGWSWGKY